MILNRPNEKGHSTWTASKATGQEWGSSKSATLVAVKMGDWSHVAMMSVFRDVLRHIVTNNRQGKSVVSISWGHERINSENLPLPLRNVKNDLQVSYTLS